MKPAYLLALGGGLVAPRRQRNPFRLVERERLPFLLPVEPVNSRERGCGPDPGSAGESSPVPAGRASRFEAIVLRAVGSMFLVAVVVCGLGTQRIAYLRARNELGRHLHQKELELRAVSQAFQSLEAEKAVFIAQGFPDPETPPAQLASARATPAAKLRTPAGVRDRKSARANSGDRVLSSPRLPMSGATASNLPRPGPPLIAQGYDR